MIFGRQWHLLAQEAELTKAMILAGLTSLSDANYDRRGGFYAAFFQLSTGFERIIKLAMVLEHRVSNQLANPSDKALRGLGHKIIDGYSWAAGVASAIGLSGGWEIEEDSVEHDVLSFLSTFAVGARYYNLNELAGSSSHEDPVVQWSQIHRRVGMTFVSARQRKSIEERSVCFADANHLFGWERSIDGTYITQVEGLFLHELFRSANPHCVWLILRLMRPFYSLLRELCQRAVAVEEELGMDTPQTPYLEEFFPFLLCDKRTAIRRKNWTKVCE